MRKLWMLILSGILMLGVLAACGNKDEASEDTEENSEQEDFDLDIPEPDLEGLPDIVAEINGVEISKEDFTQSYEQQYQQVAMQSQLSGQEVDQDQIKEQVAEGLVGQELLIQEADKRDIEISDEDIDTTLDEIVTQYDMENKDELLAAYEEQGIDEEELLSMIETRTKVELLIADESGDIEPTEEELKEAYELFKNQMGEGDEEFPSLEEMKPDLEEQVKYQKEAEATQTLIEKLREKADVTIHL